MVLLKNTDGLLPLDTGRVQTLAVIGPDSWPASPTGGGSAEVDTFQSTSFLTGISDFLGRRVQVLYSPGLAAPTELMAKTEWDALGSKPCISVETFDNAQFQGRPISTNHFERADQWKSELWPPSAKHPSSLRWKANYTPRASGRYLILVAAGGADGYALYLDDRKLLEQKAREGQAPAFTTVDLIAGQSVNIRVDYVQFSEQADLGFGIVPLDQLVSPEAKRISASADAVIVCAGFSGQSESEGFDRTFELPWGQDLLIQAIEAANPHTIVTVTSGGAVDMRPWLDHAAAVIETWYPGQEGGTALAEILFGARSPEGRLPVTFDRSWEENPAHDYYEPVLDPITGVPTVRYKEGLFMGYRYYTSRRKEPLFPFGFGLSYTTFEFSHLYVPKTASAATGIDVSFDVTNIGNCLGTEVAQLYVGDPSSKAERPVRELKSFQKVSLAPRETKHVTLHLDRRSFAYWNPSSKSWRVDIGEFTIYVGDSSANLPLIGNITILL
jgi:beta-glucosidase